MKHLAVAGKAVTLLFTAALLVACSSTAKKEEEERAAAAAEQQTAVAHDIDRNIVAINEAGQRTAAGAGHTEQASRELTELVGRLQQLIGAFRV